MGREAEETMSAAEAEKAFPVATTSKCDSNLPSGSGDPEEGRVKRKRGRPPKSQSSGGAPQRLLTLDLSQSGYYLSNESDGPPQLENEADSALLSSPQKRRRRAAKRKTPEDFLYGDLGDFSFLSKPNKRSNKKSIPTKDDSLPDSFFAAVTNSCAICGEEREAARKLESEVTEGEPRTLRDCLSHFLAIDSRRLPQTGICTLCLPALTDTIKEESRLRESVEKLRRIVSSRERYPLTPVNPSLEVKLQTSVAEPAKRKKGAFHAKLAFDELKIKSNYRQEMSRAVEVGNAEKVANAVWKDNSARKAILSLLQYKIGEEVNWFARKDSESWFRRVPDPDGEVDFEPEKALNEFEDRAPLLFQIVGAAGIKSKVKLIGRKGGISEAIKLEWKKRYIPTLTGIFANILKLRDPGGCSAFQYYNTKILHDQGVGPKVLHILHKLGVTAAASTWRNLRKPGIAAQESDRQKMARVSTGQSTTQQLGRGGRYVESELMDDLDFAVPPEVSSEDVEVYASNQFSEDEVLRAEGSAVAADPNSISAEGRDYLFCELCNLLFTSEKALVVHERSRHGLSQMPGSFTSKTTHGPLERLGLGISGAEGGYGGYGPIERKASRPASYPCVHCKRTFSDAANLKLHQLVDHAVKIQRVFYQCYDCGRQFEDVKKLWSHIKVHTAPQTKEYTHHSAEERREYVDSEGAEQCGFCAKSFPTKRKRLAHEQKVHLAAENVLNGCTFCGREFASVDQLKSHTRTEHPGVQILQDSVLVCEVCREQFADQMSLDSHMRMHIGEDDLLCYECDMNFGSIEERKAHFDRVHDVGKVFTCNLCGAEFSARQEIHEHLRVQHDRDTPNPLIPVDEPGVEIVSTTSFPPENSTKRVEGEAGEVGKGGGEKGVEEESALVEVVDFTQPSHFPQLDQWAHMANLD